MQENTAAQKILDFRRQLLRDLLSQCTDKNRRIFNLMYVSVEDIPDSKIDWALKQCENTLAKTKNSAAA